MQEQSATKSIKYTEVIDPIKAAEEVSNWLDNIGIFPNDRKGYAAQIRKLTDAVSYGLIIINEDDTITHKLIKPIGEAPELVQELTYNPDMELGEMGKRLQGAKSEMAVLSYYVAGCTGQPIGIINKMKPADSKIMQALMVFFMS